MIINGLTGNFATSYEVMRDQFVLDAYDVEMDFEKCDEMTVGFKKGRGYIRCAAVNHFNRLLGLFAEHYNGEDFEIKEKVNFKTLSLMLDISFKGPITVEGIKEYFTYLAAMARADISLTLLLPEKNTDKPLRLNLAAGEHTVIVEE